MYPNNLGRRTSIPHNTYPHTDLFLQSMERRFGNNGYAFYFKMQELIFRNPQAEIPLDMFNSYSLLADMVGVDENLFVDMLEYALTQGFFDRKMYDRRNVLTSFAFKQATFETPKRPDYNRSNQPLNMVERVPEETDEEPLFEPDHARTQRASSFKEPVKMAKPRIPIQRSQDKEDKDSLPQRLANLLPHKRTRFQESNWKDKLPKPKMPKGKFKIPISKLATLPTKAKDFFFVREDEEIVDEIDKEMDNEKQ